MENNQTIGAKLVALRRAKGVTQADLGAYLNISYQAVSKWERDESCPDFNTLSRIAQFFSVPITYFENNNGETAYTATVAQTTPVREMLGVCKDCGKVVYAGGEGATTPVLVCKECTDKRVQAQKALAEAAKKRAEQKQKEMKYAKAARVQKIARSRNRGLIWGGITAVIMFALMIFSVIDTDDVGATIGGGLLLTALGFTYTSQLFWDGAVLDCTLAGGKIIGTPGIIFTFDLDGFIFLIAMKILFAVIKFIVWLLTVVVCAVAAIVISPFTFVPALIRVNKGDLV